MGKARTTQTQSDAGDGLPSRVSPAAPAPLPEIVAASNQPGDLAPSPAIDNRDFEVAFGQSLDRTLDLDTWQSGLYLCADWERIERELGEALEQGRRNVEPMRKLVFPLIASRPNAPKGAGVFQATEEQLKATQMNVLFNGGVEACDGTCAVHDTLPLTITQIGVCLVSYLGEQGAWGHRLFRRDLRMRGQDPLGEALELLQRRELRGGIEQESLRDQLSEFGRRGIMSYAERAILLAKARSPWRMGHGQPAPYELLTGNGGMVFLRRSLELLRALLLEYRRFVFVPSAPGERVLLTIGQALQPLEFAVVDTYRHRLDQILRQDRLGGEFRELAEAFTKEAGPEILIGVYRTYAESPPQVFYAHADFVQDAALVAMADSLLQAQRTFPTLIDLADNVCSSLFGTEGFNSTIQTAYAKYGQPLRYLGERETRR
jgi:hypothetical protein